MGEPAVQAATTIDQIIQMERKAFQIYLAMGLLILVAAAAILIRSFYVTPEGDAVEQVLKIGALVVPALSALPFEKCFARHERIGTLLLLKRRCEELAADPASPGRDLNWVRRMVERLFEKRLLG